MIRRRLMILLLSLAFVPPVFVSPVVAQQAPRPAIGVPADSVTHHRFKVGSGEADFTVTAGTLPLVDGRGDQQASVFYVAYARDDATHDTRPITFVFNGGPGASSAYLHIGALGPRVVDFGSDFRMQAAPVRLIDNPDSWLGLTDLVFVDPVGTGYSVTTSTGDDAGRRYWGVNEDLQSLTAFIQLYLTRNERVNSPKYLVGESYGGFRAARLPQLLASERGISIAGVFLLSPVLDFSLKRNSDFEPLPDALRLPTYAAVRLERTTALTPAALVDVEHFALGPYLTALAATPWDAAAMKSINAAVARYTGLPEAVVAQYGGRIPPGVFVKESRRDEKLLLSHYDASVAGVDPYPEQSGARSDPLYDPLRMVLTTGIAEYLATSLKVHTDQPYRLVNGNVTRQWNWRSGYPAGGGYASATDELRDALALNPQFKVMVAHGMTDLVTPYFTSRYLLDHLPPALTADRVTLNLYPGGHMMYLRPLSRGRLRADAAKLYPASPL